MLAAIPPLEDWQFWSVSASCILGLSLLVGFRLRKIKNCGGGCSHCPNNCAAKDIVDNLRNKTTSRENVMQSDPISKPEQE